MEKKRGKKRLACAVARDFLTAQTYGRTTVRDHKAEREKRFLSSSFLCLLSKICGSSLAPVDLQMCEKGDFGSFEGAESEGFSGGEFGFVVEALNNPAEMVPLAQKYRKKT